MLALHAYTRCDTTSAFKGIGKVKPIRVLQKKPRFQEVFGQLGQSWEISENLFQELEHFTCLLYKVTTVTEVDELRYQMLLQKCGKGPNKALNPKKNINFSTLPPPRVCLKEHIKRVNYQVGIWKRAHVPNPEIPLPTDDNGWNVVGETIEPKWCEGEILPPKVADILRKVQHSSDETTDSDTEDEYSSDSDDVSSSDSDSD